MLKRVQHRPDEFPANESAPELRPFLREVGGKKRIGQLGGDHRPRRSGLVGADGRHRHRAGGVADRRGLQASGALHLALKPARDVGNFCVLLKQREQRGLTCRGLRQDRGHSVQSLEESIPLRLGNRGVSPGTGSLLAYEQRDRLISGLLPRRRLPALNSSLDLPYRFREDRDQPVVVLSPASATPGIPADSRSAVTVTSFGQPITLFVVRLLRHWQANSAQRPDHRRRPDMAPIPSQEPMSAGATLGQTAIALSTGTGLGLFRCLAVVGTCLVYEIGDQLGTQVRTHTPLLESDEWRSRSLRLTLTASPAAGAPPTGEDAARPLVRSPPRRNCRRTMTLKTAEALPSRNRYESEQVGCP